MKRWVNRLAERMRAAARWIVEMLEDDVERQPSPEEFRRMAKFMRDQARLRHEYLKQMDGRLLPNQRAIRQEMGRYIDVSGDLELFAAIGVRE